jgi:hypothetical protein
MLGFNSIVFLSYTHPQPTRKPHFSLPPPISCLQTPSAHAGHLTANQDSPDPVPADLLPLDLLPRDRQLAPQRLERALVEPREPAAERLLERALRGRDGADGLGRRRPRGRRVDVPVRLQPHVAVLVVVHVDADAAGQRAGARVEDVPGAPAAVPWRAVRLWILGWGLTERTRSSGGCTCSPQ